VAGPVLLSATQLGANTTPGGWIYLFGYPIGVTLALVGFSRWPIDSSRHSIIKGLLAFSLLVAGLKLALRLWSSELFGCHQWGEWAALNQGTTVLLALLNLVNIAAPIYIGRSVMQPNAFQQAQMRAILWSLYIGLG
jgi:hypothetical protein